MAMRDKTRFAGISAIRFLAGVLALPILWQPALYGATIGATTLAPTSIPAGVGTQITATASITDPGLIPSTVTLVQVDPSGRTASLGVMHDDGANGDTTGGDHIFTLQTTILQANPGALSLRVSAGFQGSLSRVFSPVITLTITGAGTSVNITSPAVSAYLNTSPTIVSGTVANPSAQVTVNGVAAQVTGGSFSASVPLQEGTNTLTAVANNGFSVAST